MILLRFLTRSFHPIKRVSYGWNRVSINNNIRLLSYSLCNFDLNNTSVSTRKLFEHQNCNRSLNLSSHQIIRSKYKAPKGRQAEEIEDTADPESDEVFDKHTKVVKAVIGSLRADLIVKAGLGIARNKVETLFYESKIRVNGKKLLKKSFHVNVGDEIDVIKGVSQMNPNHLIVQRVEVLNAKSKDDGEGITVGLRRHKSLTIENYEHDPYTGGTEEK